MGTLTPSDSWSSGAAYEPYVGRWSRLVAAEFVAWLAEPAGRRWLDVGCGTGALTRSILDTAEPEEVVGVDPSPAYVEYAGAQVADPRVRFRVGGAEALELPDRSVDVVVSGLVLNFVGDRPAALAEMRRVVRDGGRVAGYVWDYPGEMWLMKYFWDAAVDLDPAAHDLHEGHRFDFCVPPRLEELFRGAGLDAVRSRGIVVPTRFGDFDDYWSPFLGGQAPAPSYLRSLEPEHMAALRELVRERLPVEADGSIPLTARAWAVAGTR